MVMKLVFFCFFYSCWVFVLLCRAISIFVYDMTACLGEKNERERGREGGFVGGVCVSGGIIIE